MIGVHHVQLACPPGGEAAVRPFYTALGFTEVPKPETLRGRGGCWFRAYDGAGDVAAELHIGVEEPFIPARKAHPALLVADLDEVATRLVAAGHPVDVSEAETFAGYRRFHTADPHGNRVEVLEHVPDRGTPTKH